jgi:hypothetical protein
MKQTSPKHRKHVHLGHFVCPEECLPESRANVFWRIRQSSINGIRTLCQRAEHDELHSYRGIELGPGIHRETPALSFLEDQELELQP